jgi:hypothetical protein
MRRCALFLGMAALLCLGSRLVGGQQPANPAPGSAEQQTPSATALGGASSSKGGKQKYSHANDFVIRGTVFTDQALAFPGVELRVRRAGDKKFRLQDYTNSRGEFAIRVPQGFEYQMMVHAKGFADQTRTIDAKMGPAGNNLVFQMERSGGEKK